MQQAQKSRWVVNQQWWKRWSRKNVGGASSSNEEMQDWEECYEDDLGDDAADEAYTFPVEITRFWAEPPDFILSPKWGNNFAYLKT